VTTILVTGKTGQVGWELQRTLAPLGRVIAPSTKQMDLSNPDTVRDVIRQASPNIIVNAAGFTAVDQAESQPAFTMQVNGFAPGVIAETAEEVGALLVHYSTVFVFDGNKNCPYVESDPPRPLNTYGKTKLAGEAAIIACGKRYVILRASWTYSDRRTNFPLTILRLARERKQLSVVDDQIAAPTWARAYAEATAQLLVRSDKVADYAGIYHLSADGQTTRYQWTRRIIEIAQERCSNKHNWAKLCPTTTAEYPLPAARPLYNVMDNSKINEVFGIRMHHWEEQLNSFFSDLPTAMPATIRGGGR
jgi:dTDP-4-dehydrorhamnose reductase